MSGSATTVRWLLREGLLDELRLLVHPILVGDGLARLFPADEPTIPLSLAASKTFKSGVLDLTYVPRELREAADDRADRGDRVRLARRRHGGAGRRGFKYEGWSFEFDRGEEGNRFKLDETLGRTACCSAGAPTRASPAPGRAQRPVRGEAQRDAEVPRLDDAQRPGVEQHDGPGSGDATAQVRELKERFDGVLQVPGSHRLVQELIESDLVDQINLMVFPVILGTGKKAFDAKEERRRLRLVESKVVGDGVLVLIYERDR